MTAHNNEREERSKEIQASIAAHRRQMEEELGKAYRSLAWENRYTLHPRRLGEIAGEDVDCFLAFLSGGGADAAQSLGRRRAEEGLTRKAVLRFGEIVRRFCLDRCEQQDTAVFRRVLDLVDRFVAEYLEAFIDSREKQILRDQEQLRIALSAALERQRTELYIKDYAIHTTINGILIAERGGRITYANPAFIRMWGYGDAEQVLSSSMSGLFGEATERQIEQALSREGSWQGEITCKRVDGTDFEVAMSVSIIFDAVHTPLGIMTSVIDVTQRHHLEAQFRQAQKMEALGQLAGGIVHDFNNLLTAISGYAQLELMDLPPGSDQYNDFLQIKMATDRGMDLTQELRMFTRHSSSDLEPINANEVVEETYKILKRTFPPEIGFDLKMAPNLRIIRANPSQIIQMLMNLCVNARDAIQSPSGGEVEDSGAQSEGLIRLKSENVTLNAFEASRFLNARAGQYVRLTVEDTGSGMTAEVIDRLFEPFFTTKGERRGTGLGLAVVYGIVQNHSGFIDVKSKKGQGSSFDVYLPVFEGDGLPSKADEYAPNLTSGKGRVLVADDDIQVREMVIRALKKSGYSVIAVDNGLEAMLKFKAEGESIDLVVLDMIMPQMSGRDCMARLKEIDPRVKVLIMTGYTTDGSADELLDEGAIGLIRKPFELQSFTESVRRAISGS